MKTFNFRNIQSGDDARRKTKRNERTPLYPWELSDADLHALETAEPPDAAAEFDHETKASD